MLSGGNLELVVAFPPHARNELGAVVFVRAVSGIPPTVGRAVDIFVVKEVDISALGRRVGEPLCSSGHCVNPSPRRTEYAYLPGRDSAGAAPTRETHPRAAAPMR